MASNSSEKVQIDKIKGKELPQKFSYLKDKVAIVKLDDYQPENIKNALKSIFELSTNESIPNKDLRNTLQAFQDSKSRNSGLKNLSSSIASMIFICYLHCSVFPAPQFRMESKPHSSLYSNRVPVNRA